MLLIYDTFSQPICDKIEELDSSATQFRLTYLTPPPITPFIAQLPTNLV